MPMHHLQPPPRRPLLLSLPTTPRPSSSQTTCFKNPSSI
jgi:hypothetical protein